MNPTADSAATAPPPHWVRHAVRGVLEQAPGYWALDAERRRALAQAMVKVSALAADLVGEEAGAQRAIDKSPPLARAQDVPAFGASAERIAPTTRSVLNAVSFPRFVTDLINGVFKAMLDSSSQQMHMYVELLNNVAASADGFAGAQFSQDYVKRWLVDKFPDRFEIEEPERDPGDPPPAPEDAEPTRLRLRGGASMPDAETLRAALGIGPEESVDAGSPEQLVPLSRRQIARQRQQMLATMVMLGMQRIVVDSGRINASMRFHIDTHSAANQDQGSTFSEQNRIKGEGGFKVGPWGASAEIENNIGYVSTQRSQSSEEMNTDLDLNSSVEINFRSDYLPLNTMAAKASADRIRANSLNPDADATTARSQREAGQRQAEQDRRRSIDESLKPPAPAAARPSPNPVAGAGTGTGSGAASGASSGTGSSTSSGAGPGPRSDTSSGTGSGAGTGSSSSSAATPRASSGSSTAPGSGSAAAPVAANR